MKKERILAIDPTHRGFGYAVFDGPDFLVDWGVTYTRRNNNQACLKRIRAFLTEYEPDTLVIEDAGGRGSRRCTRIERLLTQAELAAKTKGVKVRKFSRAQIRVAFRRPGEPNKEEIAAAIAERFPELSPRVPPARKPWMSEDEGMNIFDAASLGITYYRSRSQRKRGSKGTTA